MKVKIEIESRSDVGFMFTALVKRGDSAMARAHGDTQASAAAYAASLAVDSVRSSLARDMPEKSLQWCHAEAMRMLEEAKQEALKPPVEEHPAVKHFRDGGIVVTINENGRIVCSWEYSEDKPSFKAMLSSLQQFVDSEPDAGFRLLKDVTQ